AGKKQVKFIVNPLKWPKFKTPAVFKQQLIPEASLKKFRSIYADTEPINAVKKLPTVQVRGKTNYDESKRVSKNSAIITSDGIPEGGNVGNAVLGISGLHVSQGYLLIGGLSSMRGPAAIDEPLILVNGAQAALGAGSGIGETSPALSFLNSLNGREIDFIEVLKGTDASNYGVRGGNGVILINMAVNRKDLSRALPAIPVFIARGISDSPTFPEVNTFAKNSASLTPVDKRSTIFWEGGILLKPSETKTFNFYTSSIPANYKATISGVTSRGDVIYKSFTFKSR
ncbi:MAG: TonB-dependent receptor plug domain-containing protein, partial [Ginsengibacter sp.]